MAVLDWTSFTSHEYCVSDSMLIDQNYQPLLTTAESFIFILFHVWFSLVYNFQNQFYKTKNTL